MRKDVRWLTAVALLAGLFPYSGYAFAASKPETVINTGTANDLLDLIASRSIEGIPLETFAAFQRVSGSSSVAAAVLNDPSKSRQWSNAVYALGAIGDREAKTALDRFLRAELDPITKNKRLCEVTFDAKVDTFYALGYMALHSKDAMVRSEAFRFLEEANGVSARLWPELTWQSPRHRDQPSRNAYLVTKVRNVLRIIEESDSAENRALATRSRATEPRR